MISFGSNNLSVVHVCDYVGKAKHPGIVRYDDRSPFRMHGICGNQLHHGFSGRVIERGGGLVTSSVRS